MADIYKIQQNSNGSFTVFERDNGRWEIERPSKKESFKLSRDGSQLLISERDDGLIKQEIYSRSKQDGLFRLESVQVVGGSVNRREQSYKVDRISGNKINVFEWENGRWEREKPSRNERFKLSKNGTTFKKIEREKEGTEIYVYKDPDGDGIFDFVNVRFQGAGSDSRQRRSAFEADPQELIATAEPLL